MPLLEGLMKLIGWALPIFVLAVIILPQAMRILREPGTYERLEARTIAATGCPWQRQGDARSLG